MAIISRPSCAATALLAAALPALVSAETPPCATPGMGYSDPQVLSFNGGVQVDAYECQIRCQENALTACQYFTFFEASKECWLAAGEGVEHKAMEGALGGPRHCPLGAPTLGSAPRFTWNTTTDTPGVNGSATTYGPEEERLGSEGGGHLDMIVAVVALGIATIGAVVCLCAYCCGKKKRTVKKKRGSKLETVEEEQDVPMLAEEAPQPIEPTPPAPATAQVAMQAPAGPTGAVDPAAYQAYMAQQQAAYAQQGMQYATYQQVAQPMAMTPVPQMSYQPQVVQQQQGAVGLTPPVIAPSFFSLA